MNKFHDPSKADEGIFAKKKADEGKSNVKICKGLSIVVLVSWLLWRERIDRSRLQQQKSSACFPIGPACI
jgi:hypothetical protein